MRVHVTDNSEHTFVELLQGLLRPGIDLTMGPVDRSGSDFEILVDGVPELDDLLASPALRALIIPWAGLPNKTRERIQSFPNLAVHNLHHNARPVAELAITLMMSAARQIVPIDAALRRGDWRPRYADPEALLLNGQNVLILGYGAIGRLIGEMCLGLGMQVSAVSRTGVADPSNKVAVVSGQTWHDLLPRTQVLFVALPLTDQTRGLIDAHVLNSLPENGIIVNIARGSILDQEALYRELESGRLRAGLDVWYNYPQSDEARAQTNPSDFPFDRLPNVVMTPHLAGHTLDTERLRAEHLAAMLNVALDGDKMPNRIDPDLGY